MHTHAVATNPSSVSDTDIDTDEQTTCVEVGRRAGDGGRGGGVSEGGGELHKGAKADGFSRH